MTRGVGEEGHGDGERGGQGDKEQGGEDEEKEEDEVEDSTQLVKKESELVAVDAEMESEVATSEVLSESEGRGRGEHWKP